jgi:TPR repeat protein
MYAKGLGVPQDHAAGAHWLRKAADKGLAVAQLVLGDMYFRADGVPQDYRAAASWYRKAADQGNRLAQHNLAFMYTEGWGVPQNYVIAHMWYNLAAATEDSSKPLSLRNAAKGRVMVAAKMTPAQIAEAQRLAREWKPKSTPR